MNNPPKSLWGRLKYIGPSVIVTGSVVGSGSIVMTPLLGAAAGFTLLWWLLLSMWSKPIIQAEISRYVVVTRKTFLEAFLNAYYWRVKCLAKALKNKSMALKRSLHGL